MIDSVLTTPQTKCKASSTLNRSSQYAVKNIFDDNSDTCWNSDQGSPQTLMIDLEKLTNIKSIRIMFQGGFVGLNGKIETTQRKEDPFLEVSQFHDISDNNDLQTIQLASAGVIAQYIRVIFTSSSDFYGRVTIYKLEILGHNIDIIAS